TPKVKMNINNRTQTFSLHKLVAQTFIHQPSLLHNHVIHLDRNTHNNEVENLRWVTREEALRKVSARNDGQEVIKFFPGEVYKIIDIKSITRNYAITNFGRLISFSEKVEQGFVMKVSEHAGGYKIWRYKDEHKKYRHHLIHRLVAQYFLERPSEEHD